MGKLVNEFSWSKSQDEQFRECRRRYHYSRYGSWEGWPSGDGDARAKELYQLKQLKTGRMWLGEVVHWTIEQVLKGMRFGHPPTEAEAMEKLTARMRQDFQDSKDGRYRQDPKRICRLFEHEYQMNIRDEKWVQLHETAQRCLRNFFQTKIYQQLRPLRRDQWRAIEELEEFIFEGTKLFVKLDLAVATGDGLLIADWKTGQEEDVDFDVQLGIYFLFAVTKWRCPPERIEALQVELALPKEILHRGQAAKVEWVQHYIRNSVTAMKANLRDPEKNLAVEEDFPKVNQYRSCSWCNFKRVCQPEVLAVS